MSKTMPVPAQAAAQLASPNPATVLAMLFPPDQAGQDPPGRQIGKLRVPTLVADGTLDQLDPTANDRLLAGSVPGARLILYPDAGHAFLFQDASSFIPAVERFLG
jgi:pimeloyl-ACP methyl ester carboxylesterase